MLVSDILDRVLVESGQFLLRADGVELNTDNFVLLLKSTLTIYNKYFPRTSRVTREVKDVFLTYVTPDGFDSRDYVPEWIANVTPLRILGVTNPFVGISQYGGVRKFLEFDKQSFTWKYESPTLYIPMGYTCDITEVYNFYVSGTAGSEEIKLLEENSMGFSDFLNHVTGKFMIALGRSRKAFVINDIPITGDFTDMVTDGQTLVEKSLTDMADNQPFYLGYRDL